MAQPFLHFGDIGFMREGIGGGCRSHGMHTQPLDLDIEGGCLPIFSDDISIEGIRIERPLHLTGTVVAHRPEEGPVNVADVTSHEKIALDQPTALARVPAQSESCRASPWP